MHYVPANEIAAEDFQHSITKPKRESVCYAGKGVLCYLDGFALRGVGVAS